MSDAIAVARFASPSPAGPRWTPCQLAAVPTPRGKAGPFYSWQFADGAPLPILPSYSRASYALDYARASPLFCDVRTLDHRAALACL